MIQSIVRAPLLAGAVLLLSSLPAGAEPDFDPLTQVQAIPQERDPALETARQAIRRRDFEGAVRLWQEAADRGSARAQFRLGAAYRSGLGVPRDLTIAIEWLERAARGGDTDAQFALSSLYLTGTGVEPNRSQALEWLGRAARGGHKKAKARVAELGSTNAFALGSSRVGSHPNDPQRALLQAIRVGDLASVQEALVRGARADHRPNALKMEAPLLLAIQQRHNKIVQLLLQNGASPNTESGIGESALILSSQFGESEIAELLIEAGAQIDCLSPSGTTPLMEAARSGDLETIDALLAGGADPRATLANGASAADLARRFNHASIADRLRKAGAPSQHSRISQALTKDRLLKASSAGLPPVIEAARRGEIETLRTLARSGMTLHVVDADGDTALHRASEGGHLEVVRLLLARGVPADIKGREGTTSLMRAMGSSAKRTKDVMQVLLIAGADPRAIDANKANLLRYAADGASTQKLDLIRKYEGPHSRGDFALAMEAAARAGKIEALSALFSRAPNRTDRSPAICAAVSSNQKEAFQLLLSEHPPGLGLCADGTHLLMLTARLGREEFLAALLRAGVKPVKPATGRDTALIAAAGRGYLGIVDRLQKAGADVDHRGVLRITALQNAAANGHLEVVRLLLKRGADPRLRNAADERALDLARNAGHAEVAQLIESAKTSWGGW